MIPPGPTNPSDEPQDADGLEAALSAGFGPMLVVADGQGSSVLAQLENRLGSETRVHLRDQESEPITTAGTTARYQILEEIARGGMGIITRTRDNDLGRDVAMKVLQPQHADNRAMVRRFLEEAQIAGQLQHPGILQVYELGMRPDGRPYFTMKLIKGRTLSELLEQRESPDDDRRRLIGIFERICQTMAYAHSRGVIHRDLKPANVMVGNFGEVQIVDWGLAKVIGRPPPESSTTTGVDGKPPHETEIRIPDADGRGPKSIAGSIMGTPAYMPPEQARGDVDQIDERCDVFALGAVLCEMLTGEPPYTGGAGDALEDAKVGHLDDAWARLDSCGADDELIELARSCLSRRRRDRPENAAQVAAAVSAYVTSTEERARTAELAAVEARARAGQERRARRLVVALAASIVAAVILAGTGLIWNMTARMERMAADSQVTNDQLNDAMALLTEAKETPVSESRPWIALRAARASVAALTGTAELDAETRDRASAFLAEFTKADSERRMIERIENLVIEGATHEDPQSWLQLEAQLRKAYRDYGIDVLTMPRHEIAERIRESDLAPQLADGLELWVGTIGYLAEVGAMSYTRDEIISWVDVLYDADPDPYRTSIREQVYSPEPDVEALVTLATSDQFDTAMPRTLAWLGHALMRANSVEAMDDVFRRALLLHPTDFMLNFDYAYMLQAVERWEEAVRYYHRALTIRPKNAGIWRRLGVALRTMHDVAGSLDALDQSINYQPDYAPIWVDLGLTRAQGKDLAGSIAAYRKAITLDSDLAIAHCHLGLALQSGSFLSEALIELQRGHELGLRNPMWSYPSQQWIDDCRQLLSERKTRPTSPWRTPG